MTDNNVKTAYTQDEVKIMMQACLKGINASNKIEPAMYALYINEDHSIYHTIDEVQNQFSQILRILNAEYNEICKAVEAAEREANDESIQAAGGIKRSKRGEERK